MKKINFSKEEYISILTLAKKQKYIICPVRKARQLKKNNSPLLILRHDVDLDIDMALSMACLEKKENIQATYFILLYNNFYNPFSPENRLKIAKIKECGHEIGIHWDSRDYSSKGEVQFRRDLKILSEKAGEKIISGSQHEPAFTSLFKVSSVLKFEVYKDFKDFVYVSDSSMAFRQDPYKFIKNKLNIQFLVHPFWWMTKGKTRKEKFDNFVSELDNRNHIRIEEYYNFTEDFLKNRDNKDK